MLSPPLRRYRCRRPLEDLEKRLLNALARNIPRNRGIFRFSRNLIDFINVDDTALCFLDVVVCRLDQLQQNVLDILADIACLRERGCIGDGKRHIQDACQCLRQQGLAAASGANHENIRLTQFHVLIFPLSCMNPLIMIIDRNRQ